MRTLEEEVRYLIGQEGPQLPADEYEERIDEVLNDMSPAEPLHRISLALSDPCS